MEPFSKRIAQPRLLYLHTFSVSDPSPLLTTVCLWLPDSAIDRNVWFVVKPHQCLA